MAVSLEIVRLRSRHVAALTDLFSLIASEMLSSRFHPHPFTAIEADRICNSAGKDSYAALQVEDRLLAYGMLRGWDEGYSVPSLGIYVAPKLRGSGAAVLMMKHLHLTARLSGTRQVRLTVYSDNIPAYKLYQSLGYHFSNVTGQPGQLVGILNV